MKLPFFISVFLLFFVITVFPSRFISATSAIPLGGRCVSSHECGRNLGCRKSNLGDFFVCKITVPTTSGCAVNLGENMCADGLVCEKNRCLPSYGLEDLENGKFRVPIEEPEENPVFALPDGALPIRAYATLSTGKKIVNFALAVAFLVGLTTVIKGWLTYTTATGFIPQEKKGFALLAIGAATTIGSVVLWLLTS